jgi:NAD(P)-dependent dehydrogenase (short-subunit alcohol dehydrogenase family)
MSKAHLGIWMRIIIALIGIFIFQFSVVASFLCISFIMLSASLRLIRESNPGSFFHSLLGLLTGITLTLIVVVCVALIVDLIFNLTPHNKYGGFFEDIFRLGTHFILFSFFLITFNTVICAINIFIQYYNSAYEMNQQFENQTILMTGGTSGLGKIAALHALANGAHLILIARNVEKGVALEKIFRAAYPDSKGELTLVKGDLSSLESIVDACVEVQNLNLELNQIVLNAGIMNFKRQQSHNGIEETLQVNLLAPILIIDRLHSLLKQDGDSKIVITSSGLHQGAIHFDDIEFLQDYSAFKVYRQSKLGTILMSRLLAQKIKNVGIYTQHPGVVKTELGRDAGWFSKLIFSLMGKSPKKGARTLIYLMESRNADLSNGGYYAKAALTKTTQESYDMAMAEALLEVCKGYLEKYIDESGSII